MHNNFSRRSLSFRRSLSLSRARYVAFSRLSADDENVRGRAYTYLYIYIEKERKCCTCCCSSSFSYCCCCCHSSSQRRRRRHHQQHDHHHHHRHRSMYALGVIVSSSSPLVFRNRLPFQNTQQRISLAADTGMFFRDDDDGDGESTSIDDLLSGENKIRARRACKEER